MGSTLPLPRQCPSHDMLKKYIFDFEIISDDEDDTMDMIGSKATRWISVQPSWRSEEVSIKPADSIVSIMLFLPFGFYTTGQSSLPATWWLQRKREHRHPQKPHHPKHPKTKHYHCVSWVDLPPRSTVTKAHRRVRLPFHLLHRVIKVYFYQGGDNGVVKVHFSRGGENCVEAFLNPLCVHFSLTHHMDSML